ncbi:MAG: hypothetical protein JEY79_05740 [Pseudodesulfovibrio sp.]|nr:hypothetical protein [Pseudodesulfovibrio sp.]
MRVLGVIQCRMSSSRLPGKALAELGGRTVLEWVIARSCLAGGLDKVVLATSTDASDDSVAELGSRLGIAVVRGDLDDVLSRYMLALSLYPAEAVVRITADNPLTDFVSIDQVCRLFFSEELDYGYAARIPYGAGVDIFRTSMLEKVAVGATCKRHREHINTWFLDNHLSCRIGSVSPPMGLDRPDVRLTLDTRDDLERLRMIFRELSQPESCPLSESIDAYDRVGINRQD